MLLAHLDPTHLRSTISRPDNVVWSAVSIASTASMSPTTGIAASQLRQLIFYHMDNDFLDNANFLAGRLHALEPRNPDSSHLLALTYLRSRRFKAAYDSAQKYGANGRHLGCAYVFAQSCLELGRYLDGTAALDKAKSLWQGRSNWNKHSETSRRHLPDAAAVQTLLGKLWRAHGDARKAGDSYIDAHKANPFIWESFEGLCKLGAELDVEKMFRATSEMGGATKSSNATDVYTDQPRATSHPLAPHANFNHANVLTPSNDPFNTSRNSSEQMGGNFALPRVKGKTALNNGVKAPLTEWDTPTANSNGASFEEDVAMGGVLADEDFQQEQPPAAPSRRIRTGQSEPTDRPRQPALRAHNATVSDPHETTASDPSQTKTSVGGHKRTISGQTSNSSNAATDGSAAPRRSNRLFGQAPAVKSSRAPTESVSSMSSRTERETRPARAATGAKGRSAQVGRVVSGNRNLKIQPTETADQEKEKVRRVPSRNSEKPPLASAPAAKTASTVQRQASAPAVDYQAEQEALGALLKNFRQLAIGTYAAMHYDLAPAIQTFDSLPSSQRETPWVLAQLGRLHYEAADYRAAEGCFIRLLKIQPSRVEDMEVYSTILWHLKKDSTLAFLCHNLRDQSFDAPQTWVAIGNSFSLAREHDQAISAFKRATQIDENFAYAWTLMGHEYIANEEYDAALASFRKSVSADKRHYGGWYGLGRTLERQGKLEEAERHYRIAAKINPSNATLMVCIGVIYEKLHKKDNALACFSRALELAPMSALARFKKARVLMNLRDYEQALVELKRLKDVAPDEANVWFLLGKCWKGLGEKGEALRAFTTALNLDVKVCFCMGMKCAWGSS